jgi:hypothetical protein
MAEANVGSTELIPISEHSRVLMAMHKAMRADSQRLSAAAAALPDGDRAPQRHSAAPLRPSSV